MSEAARVGLEPGLRVGLFGGSFNPAHEGHVAVADAARSACALDRVVWLVSPGSPLKAADGYLPLDERAGRAEAVTAGRAWLTVSTVEAALGTRYTADTLARLVALSRARLVWIMGADSLASFHRWRDWSGIAARVPVLVVSRPGQAMAALASPAARALWRYRLRDPLALPGHVAPAWAYVHTVHEPVSATAVRAGGL